ncbi:hypothetical protein MKK69_18940 [Methylobacterium sp. J-026]|uniref:hypothetical protein n=1 Tax=Methylobacterium sp. J-026 TaxID=2836624 RepID=UPI001FB98341|nr:hypothetical protein [Methylobacterium sp. J-026]MCJ2136099.1 hypothetical protein [Methylobacterium sp. J-026]
MRTIFILASAALASAAVFAGPASAEEPLHLTPPLYRDQARGAQQARPITDLTTTPQPVRVTANRMRTVSTVERSMVQASAAPLR